MLAHASVATVRGVVVSNWTRALTRPAGSTKELAIGTELVRLVVQVPLGVREATVHLPLLGLTAAEVKVSEAGSGASLWDAATQRATLGSAGIGAGLDVRSCVAVTGADGDQLMELKVGAGKFELVASVV